MYWSEPTEPYLNKPSIYSKCLAGCVLTGRQYLCGREYLLPNAHLCGQWLSRTGTVIKCNCCKIQVESIMFHFLLQTLHLFPANRVVYESEGFWRPCVVYRPLSVSRSQLCTADERHLYRRCQAFVGGPELQHGPVGAPDCSIAIWKWALDDMRTDRTYRVGREKDFGLGQFEIWTIFSLVRL